MSISGLKDVAQRIVNAEENFTDTLVEIAGISKADAFKALATFRKAKAVKLHIGIGRITVKHGAFLAKDVILRAVQFSQ